MSNADIMDSLGSHAGARLTELGKIKVGGLGSPRQSVSGSTYRVPRKDDFFTITTLGRNQAGDLITDEKLMKDLIEKYGDQDKKLRQLPVRVLSDNIDDIIQASYVWYGGKVIGARSDGKTVEWFNDPRTGLKLPKPRVEPWTKEMIDTTDGKGRKLFKLHFHFNCVIAAHESRFGGVYKFRSTSIISYTQLYQSLWTIHQLTGGILVGMPMMLVVRPKQVAPDGKPTTVYVVHAELRGAGLMELQQQAVEQMKWRLANRQQMVTTQNQYQKLLTAPGMETEAEAEDITNEFAPEMTAAEEAPEHVGVLDDPIDASKVDHEGGNNAAAVAGRDAVRSGQPTVEVPIHADIPDDAEAEYARINAETAALAESGPTAAQNVLDDPKVIRKEAEAWVKAESANEANLREYVNSFSDEMKAAACKTANVPGVTAAHPFKNITKVAFVLRVMETTPAPAGR